MDIVKLPKSIKQKRNKKFTEKKSPYKSYFCANWVWSDIFNEIDEIKETGKNYLKETSKKYGIKYDTLSHKYSSYCKNKSKNYNVENRGGVNKIFTIDEERQLYDYIDMTFIDKNKTLNNNIIKEVALKKFKEINNFKEINKDKKFNISDGWCSMFKKNGI